MSVRLEADVVHLAGACRVEDAEPLVTLLLERPGCSVNLTEAGSLHTAVVQVLMAFRPPVIGPAADEFIEIWLLPLLANDSQV
jgi:hypothetical protein